MMTRREFVRAAAAGAAGTHNVKVNQDRNPWPKAEVGSAGGRVKVAL